MTSLDINFQLIYFLNKTLFYYIYNTISLCEKILYIISNVCDLEDVFSLIDTYATQVFKSICRLFIYWSVGFTNFKHKSR